MHFQVCWLTNAADKPTSNLKRTGQQRWAWYRMKFDCLLRSTRDWNQVFRLFSQQQLHKLSTDHGVTCSSFWNTKTKTVCIKQTFQQLPGVWSTLASNFGITKDSSIDLEIEKKCWIGADSRAPLTGTTRNLHLYRWTELTGYEQDSISPGSSRRSRPPSPYSLHEFWHNCSWSRYKREKKFTKEQTYSWPKAWPWPSEMPQVKAYRDLQTPTNAVANSLVTPPEVRMQVPIGG